MKLLHAADLQIGAQRSIEGSLERQEEALTELREAAVAEKVDAVLLAGDIFEHSRPSQQEIDVVFRFLDHLDEAHVPVQMLVGNHEYTHKSLRGYHALKTIQILQHRFDLLEVYDDLEVNEYDEFVLVAIPPYLTTIDGLDRVEWPNQERLASGKPIVMMLHVTLQGSVFRGMPEDKGFNPSVLDECGVDYIALGDIHQRQRAKCKTPAFYPGSLIQKDFGEEAEYSGYLIVTTDDDGNVHVEPRRLTRPATLKAFDILATDVDKVIEETPENCLVKVVAHGSAEELRDFKLKRLQTGLKRKQSVLVKYVPKVQRARIDSDEEDDTTEEFRDTLSSKNPTEQLQAHIKGSTWRVDSDDLFKKGSAVLAQVEGSTQQAGGASGDFEVLSVHGEHVFGYETIDFPVADQGLVLIRGQNLDEFGDGNGSGKSSVLDVLKGGIYNHTVKGSSRSSVRGKAMRNRVTKGPLKIEVEFRLGGMPYRTVVSYGHKNEELPDGIRLFDVSGDTPDDLTKKGKSEPQIVDRIGLPFNVFEGAVCVGQDTISDFVYGTNLKRQIFFAQLGGFERWRNGQELGRKLRNQLQDQLAGVQERIAGIKEAQRSDSGALYDANDLNDRIGEMTEKKEALDRERHDLRNHTRSLEARIRKLEGQKRDLDSRAKDVEKARAVQATLDEQREELEEVRTQLGPFAEDIGLFDQKKESILGKLAAAQANLVLYREQLETLKDAGAACPTCDTELSEEQKEEVLDNRRALIADLEKKEAKFLGKKETVAQFESLIEEYKDLSREIERTVVPDAPELNQEELDDLTKEVASYQKQLSQKEGREEELEEEHTEAASELARAEERLRQVVEAEAATEERATRLKQLQEEERRLSSEVDLLEVLAEEVYPGLRADDIRSLLETLNRDLSDQLVYTFRSPVKAYAKYRPRTNQDDELVLYVEDDLKGRMPLHEWSGGEGKRVSIAALFSLWKLSAAVHRSVNFAAYDEILRDVDPTGRHQILEMLSDQKASGKSIFVTSNTDFDEDTLDLFDQVWLAQRKDGISTLIRDPEEVARALETFELEESA